MFEFDKEYNVVFTSLSLGRHDFNYEVKDVFFEELEYSEIKKGSLKVDMVLDKRETMLVFEFEIAGEVTLPCDRCGDDMTLEVQGSNSHIIKFGDEEYEETEEITVLPTSAFEFNVGELIYQFIALSVPQYHTHDIKDCNPNIVSLLTEEGEEEDDKEEKSDPRWDALKNIKKKFDK